MNMIDHNKTLLEKILLKKAYKLSDVKDKIVKVAFDVVKFKDNDDMSNLWQVVNGDNDDEQYIVAMYDDLLEKQASSANPWYVEVGKDNLSIFYKNEQIAKVAANKLGLDKKELAFVPEYLPKTLLKNKKMVSNLLKEVSASMRQEIIKKFPELG